MQEDLTIDYVGLEQAASWIPTQLRRYARICVYAKEKYGTIRLEHFYPYPFITTLLWPGRLVLANKMHVWCQFKLNNKWMYIIEKTRLVKLIRGYQRLVFNAVCLRAAYKWPWLIERIFAQEEEFESWLYERTQKKIVAIFEETCYTY